MSNWYDGVDEPQARKWEYEEGDKLVGEVISTGEYDGDYGVSPTVTVRPDPALSTESGGSLDEPGGVVFYASSKIAKDEIVNAAPSRGDLIAIKFHGTQMAKNAKPGASPYKVFRIVVQKNGALAQAVDQTDGGADW